MTYFKIQIKDNGLIEKLKRFPREFNKYMQAAGKEAGKEILATQGLQEYPPETAANKPPEPYYIRGVGTQYASYNKQNSENMGKQFYVEAVQGGAKIGNRASYAKFVVGEEQASAMGAIGWKKLLEVGKEKIGQITKIFNAWVGKLLKDIGLK